MTANRTMKMETTPIADQTRIQDPDSHRRATGEAAREDVRIEP